MGILAWQKAEGKEKERERGQGGLTSFYTNSLPGQIRTLIHSQLKSPHDLIMSLRSLLSKLLHWGISLQHMNSGETFKL
jgi:hypothetical protein